MGAITSITNLVKNQIEDNTIIRAAGEGHNFEFRKFPYAGIVISGGEMNADALGSLDEDLYMTIVITARSIADFYDVADTLKTLWYTESAEFQALRALGVLMIDPLGPVGYPLTIPINDRDTVTKGQISFKIVYRHSY